MIYHKDIGFPAKFRRPVGTIRPRYSMHAIRQSQLRGITIPGSIDMRYANIVEVGYSGLNLDHLLVRLAYDHDYDLAVALAYGKGRWTAKTVWLNSVNDDHGTLHRSKYATP